MKLAELATTCGQSLELKMRDVLDNLEELSCDAVLNLSAYQIDIVSVEPTTPASGQTAMPFPPLSAIH